jgi:hypothetical protein
MSRTKEPPKSFAEGYIDGWRSVMGTDAEIPPIPQFAVPANKTTYQHGYDLGRARTSDRPRSF